jgi:hypothetical protein
MAAPTFTPIQLYSSGTAFAAPIPGNLTNGELALNFNDGKLYYKNSSSVVTLLASAAGASGNVVGPASATTDGNLAAFDGVTGKLIKQAAAVTVAQGGTGQTTFTNGQLLIGNTTGNTLTKTTLTAGANITITNGSGAITIAATGSGGVTSVTGTFPVNSTGGATPDIALNVGYGDSQNPYASKTANFVLAAPNGSAGSPTFRALVSDDLSNTLAVAKGGTGLTTYTSGGVLFASGTGTLANGTGLTFSSGNLGLGVASPFYKFDVETTSGGTTPYVASFTNTSTSTAQANLIRITQNASGAAVGLIGTGGSTFSDTAFANNFAIGTQGSNALVFITGATERVRIDTSGNLIQEVNTTAATLTVNETLTFSIVNDSTLRISVRGSDGTTRTATVALT